MKKDDIIMVGMLTGIIPSAVCMGILWIALTIIEVIW